MKQCQLIRWTTTWNLLTAGREEGGEDVEWVWLCGGCVVPPIQDIRFAVVWAVLYSGLDECVCSTAMWTLWASGGQSTPEKWCP